MVVRLATHLSKEDFKRALNDCFKQAWVWHSEANLRQMVQWQVEQKLIYWGKEALSGDGELNEDGRAIDLVQLYQGKDSVLHQTLSDQFTTTEGFSYDQFLGETLEDGFRVGEKARLLFSLRAAKSDNQVLDLSEDNFSQAWSKTQTLLKREPINYRYGFELAFSYDQEHLKIRPDILEFTGGRHVNIIEIKATSQPKRDHFFDLAYQIYVLEKNGLIVDHAFLGHLNPNFVWGLDDPLINLSQEANQLLQDTPPITFAQARGAFENLDPSPRTSPDFPPEKEIDWELLFCINPIYKKLRNREGVTYIEAYRDFNKSNYLDTLMTELSQLLSLPPLQILPVLERAHCSLRHQYRTLKGARGWIRVEPEPFCYHILPWFDFARETIFNLTGASNFTNHHKARIYWEVGIVYLDDINSLTDLEQRLIDWKKPIFLEPHYRHLEVYQAYRKQGVNFPETGVLKKPLFHLEQNLCYYQNYPIIMYDFETAKWAIPRFLKSKTYQQIPFQYSVHVLLDNDFNYLNPHSLTHHEFLANDRRDPRPNFIHSFLKAVLSYGPSKYVAYNDAFEKMILKHLAFLFPDYQLPLLYVVQNTLDLMTFFKGKKGGWPWFEVYHPEFRGSYSIKKTQPALEPNFAYDDLLINKGDQAAQTFREFIDGYVPLELWQEKIYFDLLKYCNRDTLAMVVLLQRIREIYQQEVSQNESI